MATSDLFHLLVIRHGGDPTPGSAAEAEHDEVGKRLVDTLAALSIEVDHTLRFDSEPARKTTRALRPRLSLVRPAASRVEPELTPNFASSYSGNENYKRERSTVKNLVMEDVRRTKGATGAGNAIVVVGHEPQLSVLAGDLTSGWHRSRTVPLARTEVACLTLRGRTMPKTGKTGTWTLAWAISPSDPDLERDLRQKIASKMQVAGILAAAVTAALVFLLQNLFEAKDPITEPSMQLRHFSAVSLFLAACLYVLALYYCDRLMMPARFWAGRAVAVDRPKWLVARPPSPAAWIVYQNMMRVWRLFFTPACIMLGIGILALFLSLFIFPENCLTVLYLVVGTSGVMILAWVGRPRLGVKD